jgi:hypothetical protein
MSRTNKIATIAGGISTLLMMLVNTQDWVSITSAIPLPQFLERMAIPKQIGLSGSAILGMFQFVPLIFLAFILIPVLRKWLWVPVLFHVGLLIERFINFQTNAPIDPLMQHTLKIEPQTALFSYVILLAVVLVVGGYWALLFVRKKS